MADQQGSVVGFSKMGPSDFDLRVDLSRADAGHPGRVLGARHFDLALTVAAPSDENFARPLDSEGLAFFDRELERSSRGSKFHIAFPGKAGLRFLKLNLFRQAKKSPSKNRKFFRNLTENRD